MKKEAMIKAYEKDPRDYLYGLLDHHSPSSHI